MPARMENNGTGFLPPSDMFPQHPELLTMQDVADLTGMTVQYVRRLAREGRIPAVRIGQRRWYVPKPRFIEWIMGGGSDA